MIIRRFFSLLNLIFIVIYQYYRKTLLTFQTGLLIEPQVGIAKLVIIKVTDNAELILRQGSKLARGTCLIAKYGQLEIGRDTHIGMFSILVARQKIVIGDNCLIAEFVTIRDQDHKMEAEKITAKNGFSTAPIYIGNNVWIGAKATITKGVTIGNNAVIGAGAVVTSNIPENTLAVGVPARIIRNLKKPIENQ